MNIAKEEDNLGEIEKDLFEKKNIEKYIRKKEKKIINKNYFNLITNAYKKNNNNPLIIKFIKNIVFFIISFAFIFLSIYIGIHLIKNKNNINENEIENYSNLISKKSLYENETFAILRRNCTFCGLFAFYIYYLGCINMYLIKGYIPIVDLMSFPNTYNNFSSIDFNPWESFFEQPFGFTLKEALKKNRVKIFYCIGQDNRPDDKNIYYNKLSIDYWHNTAMKYIPIKKEIIKETNIIIQKLFKGSKNILGVKIRGTDYITRKPRWHPIPPKVEDTINDVKKMDIKNNYDWIFFASEDEQIKEKFIKEFEGKIKYLNPNIKLNYYINNRTNDLLVKQKEICGNLEYAKNYVMNIYILSKCIDIVMTRGSGGAGIIILTKGFRNSLIYNLGEYS